MKKLNIENMESVFDRVLSTRSWRELQDKFNSSSHIYVVGNGGNSAIADHGAIDIMRHTDKKIISPGSAVLATSIINDAGFEKWMSAWMKFQVRGKSVEQVTESSLFLGISASGTSKNILDAIEFCNTINLKTAVITGTPLIKTPVDTTVVELNVDYYHTAEVSTLLLLYQLIIGAGFVTPKIHNDK